ncbi:MAG TPA: type VI secretion system tube protein Hcp [Steroidobacteraceae bacterium]|jgi:type VI secretion system secreted protein Hcp|nr:type VI secretion system tube protein Hcp [Steroidobacteraceae bacterium]
MAVDMFLELDSVKGETADKAFKSKNAMDILAWSWGLSNSGTFHAGTGGGAGKASFQDISITKYIDLASPNLMLFCANGKHITKGVITVRKAGENPLEYLKITMQNILVSSYSTGGSGGEDRLTENVSLNFGSVKVEYAQQAEKGGKAGSNDFGWDIAQNAKT